MRTEILPANIIIQVAIDRTCYALQRHFSQSDEVSATKKVGERWLDTFYRINVAAAHPCDQGPRRQVAHYDLVGAIKDRMAPGMVLVITDEPMTAETQSGKDFVVMTTYDDDAKK